MDNEQRCRVEHDTEDCTCLIHTADNQRDSKCSFPNVCDDEPCDNHEREWAHSEGEHELCGAECAADDQRDSERVPPTIKLTFTDTTPTVADADERDRLTRYAAAFERLMYGLDRMSVPDGARMLAEAAAAVADEEQHKKLSGMQAQALHLVVATESLAAENTRLRNDLRRSEAGHETAEAQLVHERREIERLRAELEQQKARHNASLQRADRTNNALMEEVKRYANGDEHPVLWSVYNRMHLRAANAEATIARVRAVLDAANTAVAPNDSRFEIGRAHV